MSRSSRRSLHLAATALSFVCGAPLSAQQRDTLASDSTRRSDLAPLVTLGTRFNGRVVTSSPVPIDVVNLSDLTVGGYTDLQRMLKARIPAFSLPNSNGAGSVDFVNAPTLRGLGIGQMLVLVNGKRRHTTGDLSTGQQIGRGDVGYDFNAIPTMALRQVEVLRDGAAAQYGSDAIAGVINLVLDRSTGARAEMVTGRTSRGDGGVVDVQAAYGLGLPRNGALRATLFRQDHGTTNRAGLDTRQQYFGANGTRLPSGNFGSGTGLTPANGTLDPREATIDRMTFRFGSPNYINEGLFLNGDMRAFGSSTLYAFGGLSEMKGTSPGFFRRAGQDETVRALHPDGFLPEAPFTFGNQSLVTGLRGMTGSGFTWDLSTGIGRATVDNRYTNTNNPSFGAASSTDMYRGGTRFRQWTTNLDVTKSLPIGDGSPLKVAFGAEHRRETYRIATGEDQSWQNGGQTILDGPNRGRPAPIGVQPASGYRPSDAVSADRHSNAAYVDLERQMTMRWLLSAAARYERYSDFGDNTTGKVATRIQLFGPLALRGSLSTGFRAPHLAQSWFGNTTNTVVNGALVTSRLLPVSDPVARVLGATSLTAERSTNTSAGFSVDREAFAITADAYRIQVRDRIALSSTFTGNAVTTLLTNAGFPGIVSANFLTNAVDTDTRGVEITGRWRQKLGAMGMLTATFGAMYNDSRFDRIAPAPKPLTDLGVTIPLFDATQQVRFTTGLPRDKYVLGLDWTRGRYAVNVTNIRYGQYEAVQFTSLSPERIAVVTRGFRHRTIPTAPASANQQVVQQFDPRLITDVEASVRLWTQGTFSLGINNLFDVVPTRNFPSTVESVAAGTNGADNFGTLLYNYLSPHDWNGVFLVAKVRWNY